MDMITVSAKTLDEAITKALIELQTTSEHLHYEVIEKGSSGLFGIFGAKPCVIRAKVMTEEEEKAAKKAAADKEKAKKDAERAAAKAAEEKAKAEAKAAADKAKEAARAAEKLAAEKREAEKMAAKPVEKPMEKSATRAAEKPSGRPAERTSQRATDQPYRKNNTEKKAERPERPEREVKERVPVKVDEAVVQAKAREFLIQVFGAMGMTVEIDTRFDAAEGELQVSMAGADMGILIGKRGQTLDSLQYLVSLVVNKETEGYLRVKLDTENYRERRKETLETLAKNISYKVKRTKRPVSLEPMNPYDRRIIHSALQNDKYVVTRSEGEDPYRHVVISLKREGYGGNGRRDRYQPRPKDRNGENKAADSKAADSRPAESRPAENAVEN